ncbi:hypothetical protein RhiirB3_442709 [Rhizophagus irregularis]|nr:hypothetical protein RhiirB3_442709 [Rhizophagus irregularis]
MSYNFESEVPEALGQLLKAETDYNVIIYIGEEPNFKEFHAHSIILRCRSEYFNKIFSNKNIEKKDGKYIIKEPNISPQAFDIILKYFYTGQIDITNKTRTEVLDFMIASNECTVASESNARFENEDKNKNIWWQPSQKQNYLNFHFFFSTALSSPTAFGRRSTLLADFWLKDEIYNYLATRDYLGIQ